MNIRDQRQDEFADIFIEKGQSGILNLCPRFGKCRVGYKIIEKTNPQTILIAYPETKIQKSWEGEFRIQNYDDTNVLYTTHLSMHKYSMYEFDLIIIDEIHLLSIAQIDTVRELKHKNRKILGLTGTLSSWTKNDLFKMIHLPVLAVYSIKQGIEEGIVTDYQITVIKVPLDDKILNNYNGKMKTEKKRFDSFTWVINNLDQTGKNSQFMRLNPMRLIQNSVTKKNKTIELLSSLPQERVLVFCGSTKIADNLGIPSYHSKSTEKKIFDDFAEGKGNHLAVVKIGNTGVTYKPLNRVIINNFDSNSENLAQKINRCMGLEYDNPDKKAHIYIICSTEIIELSWLQKALEFFSKEKIIYIDS